MTITVFLSAFISVVGQIEPTSSYTVKCSGKQSNLILKPSLVPGNNDNITGTWLIYDDGSAESGWIINPGYSCWLGNEFPVSSSGIIKQFRIYWLENINQGPGQVNIDVFNSNHTLIGSTGYFTPPSDEWIYVSAPDIPYDGKFFAMVHWNYLTNQTHWLGYDEDGPYTSNNLAWYYDGSIWMKLSEAASTVPGVFLIRAEVELGSINITAPIGGEEWQVGTTHNIKWTSSDVSYVKIEYSYNNGSSWTTVANQVNASSGTYSWLIPNTPSSQCKVRVSNLSIPAINDISNTFKITTEKEITVTSPNGGENWQIGSNHNITWTSSGVSNVKIEYTVNNGSSWATVVNSVNASNGSYSWTIPNNPSSLCKVRISDVSNTSVNDQSNNTFSISIAPMITVSSPNGGENWEVGSNHNITWTSSGVSNVKIEYTVNNGSSWATIVNSVNASSGSYSWTIPNTPSTQCKVRITEVSNISIYDQSNSTFTISEPIVPDITILSPNGGEEWTINSTEYITWNYIAVSTIHIVYSIDNGNNWTMIESNFPANSKSYSWTIPNTPSNSCLVKLNDASNATINDISDNIFTIINPYPGSLTINAYYEFPNPRDVTSYKIAGLPGNISIPLANVMPGTFNVNWIAFWDNGSDWDYMQANQSYAFKPGYAYWISSEQPVSIQQTVPTVTLSVDNTYTIPVHSGWNIISNPLHLNVNWSAIRAVNGLDAGYKLFTWEGYWNESDVMALNRGYYFYNSGSFSGLKIPYYSAMKLISHDEQQLYSPAVFMQLHSETKEVASISIVFDPESSFDFDQMDRLIPPGDFEKTGIRIIAPQLSIGYKQLNSEYRPEIGEGQEYLIQVKNTTDEMCVLSTTISDMTKGQEIWLVNNRINQAVNLNEKNSLNVYPSKEPWYYTLYIGPYDYIKQHIDLNRLILYPGLTCYPNPVTGKSAVGFTLPSEGDVEILLMDISGRSTHHLFNGKLCEGYHEVLISSSTTNAGVYFAKIVISLNGQDELMTDFVRIVVFD